MLGIVADVSLIERVVEKPDLTVSSRFESLDLRAYFAVTDVGQLSAVVTSELAGG